MLKCCVLVGLDWAEPMMPLILYITCSCIFHAYIPSFLYILILNCLVLFCLSFSLSLSFVSYSMAPKRKSTPSWNPLHSGASSSNSTPLHVKFRDDKARQDFSENFCRWGVYSERQVILSDFSNTDLPIVIHSRGWESLCDIPVTCPSVIIQEFYSNVLRIDTSVPHFFSRIRDTRIVVTPNIVFEVLYVPRVAHPDFPSCAHL